MTDEERQFYKDQQLACRQTLLVLISSIIVYLLMLWW